MAATGNMSLIEHMGAVMGRELRAINNIVKVRQRVSTGTRPLLLARLPAGSLPLVDIPLATKSHLRKGRVLEHLRSYHEHCP